MQVRCGRRIILTGLAAGVIVFPLAAGAEAARLEFVKKWNTGNAALSPPASDSRRIFFCGDSRAGAVDLLDESGSWHVTPPDGWSYQFRPRLTEGIVVFGGQRGYSAHAAEDGAELWRCRAKIQMGVPHLNDRQIVFGDGHHIVALDLFTGKELWRHAGVPDTLTNYAPTQWQSTILAAPGDGRLYALQAETGALLWQHDGRESWQYLRQLRMAEGVLVAGSYKEKLFGISAQDGRELWQFNAGNFINSQIVADGSAYLWSPTGFIYAVDAHSGVVRWRHETTDYGNRQGNWGPLMAELVVHKNRLLALDMFNVLHVLDTLTGKAVGEWQVGAPVRHAVLRLSDGKLVFPHQNGDIVVTNGID
jgi:outer membrane protein assembly factor BamB